MNVCYLALLGSVNASVLTPILYGCNTPCDELGHFAVFHYTQTHEV